MIMKCFSQSLNNDGRVAFNEKQCLTPSQKETARKNMGITEAASKEAPKDGNIYGLKNGNWAKVEGGGGGSENTLFFDSVAEMKAATSLSVGDIVQTHGFYSVGDGGGAKYQIQSTGTANDMDLIALNDGKIASVMFTKEMYPEQIGYKHYSNQHDISVYISRLIALNVTHIKLIAGKAYYQYTPLVITKGSVHIEGTNHYTPNPTLWNWKGGETNATCITIRGKNVHISWIYFLNDATSSVDDLTLTCIATDSYDTSINNRLSISNCRFIGYKNNILLGGTIKWNVEILGCYFGWGVNGIEILENTDAVRIYQCGFTGLEGIAIHLFGEMQALAIENCNIGSSNKAIVLDQPSNLTHSNQAVLISSCAFELDVPLESSDGAFLEIGDNNYCEVNFVSCTFTLSKHSNHQVLSDELFYIKAGDCSKIIMSGCQMLDDTQHFKNLSKLFNPSHPSKPVNGSIVSIANSGFRYPAQFNTDDLQRVVCIGGEDNQNPFTVTLFGKEYHYGLISGKWWLCENLDIQVDGSQRIADHLEFGSYYTKTGLDNLKTLDLNGWRVPTESDMRSLAPEGWNNTGKQLLSWKYPDVWPASELASYGRFDMVPSAVVGSSTGFNSAVLRFDSSSSFTNLIIQPTRIQYADYGDNVYIPIRLCKDA